MEIGKLLAIICLSDHWTIASQWAIGNTLSNLHPISCIASDVSNRAFYRYGGHIELIRFKEYYGMPMGEWARSDILAQYLRALFGPIFFSVFLVKDCMGKKDRCAVFGCNHDFLFPEKYTVKFSFCPESARKYWVPLRHPIILLKSNKFNMAALSVKSLLYMFFSFCSIIRDLQQSIHASRP